MKRFHHDEKAPTGIYVSPRHLDVRLVENGEDRLQGKPEAEYMRVPLGLLVVAGPVLGAVFAIAFPFVVFYALVAGIAERISSPRKLVPRTWNAGQAVREGVYVGVNHLGARYVSAPDEPLTGESGARFVRVPTLVMLLASPFIGAAYVVAFPFIAAAALLGVLVHLVTDTFQKAWSDHAHLADLRWSPAAAFLVPEHTPEGETKAEGEPAPLDPTLQALDAEVEARRATETASSVDTPDSTTRK